MNREQSLKYVGNMSQLAYARSMIYQDGRAKNLSAIEVKNGDIRFVVAKDKCLDILEMEYKGQNVHFMSKPGLQGNGIFDVHNTQGARSIMNGLFFTCGLSNVGPAEENQISHGLLRSTPAENISVDCFWRDDEYVIKISAQMRQAQLFGENMVLRRTIETVYGNSDINIYDEVINEGFKTEPCMILYHFNVGYPLLCENSTISISSDDIIPRDDVAKAGLLTSANIIAPVDNKPEEVFYHNLAQEKSFASIENGKMQFKIEFNKSELPFFTQWKSMASGDYALGLEPGNCHVQGQTKEKERGTLEYLKPMQTKNIHVKISVCDV